MKSLYRFIACATIIIAFSSCGYFNEDKTSDDSKDVKTIVELPDSVKKKIVKQDSLMTDIVNKLDTLTNVLNDTKKENSELKKKIEAFESPKNKWAYISLAAVILAFISFMLALWKPRENRINGIIKQYLDNSKRIKTLIDDVKSLQSNSNSISTPKVSTGEIENDIKHLKMQLKQVVNDINAIKYALKRQIESPIRQEPKQPVEPPYQKVGYAKVDQDMYFTTIFDSNQEGCVFKINFTSPDKGKFNIISLDKIQSRNDWQKKVECSGISIKDASEYRIEEDGICEKIDENTWKVTKPLKIKLLK